MEKVFNKPSNNLEELNVNILKEELLLFQSIQRLPVPYAIKRKSIDYRSPSDLNFYLGSYRSLLREMYKRGEFNFDTINFK